ncbi:TetR/AcrR family transcriptional regulator [Mycobacterium sp.]|uniref:TetR/AcrR family transcriptional regulator n=1 Tax=Mycobacterium sp. TaxID=1785 RepID=UPI003C761B9D
MTVRLRRAEQVERNRESVLEAARQVFIRRGYAGASLEAIADGAGFSKGVVYSQFGSKPDLFMALLERRIEERAAQNERIAEQFVGAEALRGLLDAAREDAAANPGWPHLLTEFRALAMRDPELNRRYAEAHSRAVDSLAAVYDRLYDGSGLTPAASARSLAEFFLGATAGVALERAANPNALPAGDLERLTARLLGLPEQGAP